MGNVIGDTLSLAIGIAISPAPIIAAILMLLSPQAKRTSPAFLVGWVAGVLIVTSLFVVLGGAIEQNESGDSKPIAGIIKLVLGLGLVLLAVRQWQSRPKPGDTPELPAWMGAINTMPPIRALGIGALLSGLNPKNLMLAASAGVIISSASLGGSSTTVVVIIFTIVASISVGGPIIAYLIAPDRLAAPLKSLRGWLEYNNTTVMAVVLLVLGVNVIGKGIGSF